MCQICILIRVNVKWRFPLRCFPQFICWPPFQSFFVRNSLETFCIASHTTLRLDVPLYKSHVVGNFPVGLVLLWGLKKGDFLAPKKGSKNRSKRRPPKSQTKRKITTCGSCSGSSPDDRSLGGLDTHFSQFFRFFLTFSWSSDFSSRLFPISLISSFAGVTF